MRAFCKQEKDTRKAMRKEFLEVGEIVTIHGVKGYFRLYPWCDDGDLDGAKFMYLDDGKARYEVEDVKPHKNIYLIKWKGIDTPEEAVKFRGKTVYMRRDDIPMGEGDYFIQDLEGLSVVDRDDPGRRYGVLKEVARTGANDIYCVKADDGAETWVPAIPDVIDEVDLERGVLRIFPMKGLFDDAD